MTSKYQTYTSNMLLVELKFVKHHTHTIIMVQSQYLVL